MALTALILVGVHLPIVPLEISLAPVSIGNSLVNFP
jgi:hypothetical protein